jgi:putative serine protease PepD
MAGALLAAALAGGTVAVIGAALVGTGEHTTTIRELVQTPTNAPGNVSQTSQVRPLTVRAIYDRDAPGVVQVTTTTKVKLPQTDWFGNPFGPPGTEVQRSLGSGFVIDKAGYIVTNYHVVGNAQSVHVSFSNNDSMKAEVIGKDPATDVALLKVEASSRALKPLQLGDSDGIHVGDQVAAIGNPLGLDRSITLGIVSALHRSLTSPEGTPIDRVIQTDAALNHGNSGGPLLDARGEVVGVNSQISTGNTGQQGNLGIGFAIPSNTVRGVVAQIIQSGHAEHAALDIFGQALNENIAQLFNLPVKHGVLVARVQSDSGAAKAGLKGSTSQHIVDGVTWPLGGDIVVAADGVPTPTVNKLRDVIAQHKPGDTITLVIYHDGSKKTIEVKLGRQGSSP